MPPPVESCPDRGLSLSSGEPLSRLPVVDSECICIFTVCVLCVMYHCVYLLARGSVLAILERGLSRSVFGDTPTSPVVSFVLLMGRGSSMADLADLLKSARSASALSSLASLVMHLKHMCGGNWSSWLTGRSRRADILAGHPLCSDFLENMLVTLVGGAAFRHNLHANLFAAAIEKRLEFNR